MAAAYRSSTTANTGSTPASSLVLSVPSGVLANDVLIAMVGVDGGTGATITAPAGWTTLKNTTQSTNTRAVIYWKLVDGYEPATYTWTLDTTRQAAAVMAAYSGANPFPPAATSTLANGTGSITINATTVNSTYETGLAIQCVAARNTTAASTITAAGSYVKRADTCTSASAFIDVAITDVAKGLTVGGTIGSAPTCNQTVTSVFGTLFLEDARPAFNVLVEDVFVVGSVSASSSSLTSSASLQTNYPNTLLLLFCAITKDATTVSSVGGGLTWTNVSRANTNTGCVEVWRTFVPTPISGQQVIINLAASAVSVNYMVVGFAGVDLTGSNGSGAIGAVATGTSSSAAPSLNLTTTRNNSWVWTGYNAAGVTGAMTAGSGQTVLRNLNDGTNIAQGWFTKQNSLTATSGTVVTSNSTAPSTASCNIISVEILPAIYHNLGATGIGN